MNRRITRQLSSSGCLASILLLVATLSLSAKALTLEEALARTLERNPAIQQARAGLEQAAGRRVVLRAIALPDAAVRVPGGAQGGKRAGEDPLQPFVFAQGALAQALFNRAIPPSFRRGNIELLLAQQRLNLAVMEQLHAARVAYHTAGYNAAVANLAETQRERLAANITAQAERYQAGEAGRGALVSAQVLEQELRPRLEETRRVYNGARLKLAELMASDLGPGKSLPSVDSAPQFVALAVDESSAATEALANRPDLQLARLLVAAAVEDQHIIEAAGYPALRATVSGDYIPVSEIRRGSEGSPQRSDDIISSELRWGVAGSWRVVDNGRVRGAVMQQRGAREANELVVQKLEANIPREIARLANQLRALAARHEALSKAAEVSEQALQDVQSNLEAGRVSPLEYRSSESSFLESKAGLLTVAYEQQLALAEWDLATGRYLQFSDDTAAKLH